MRYYNADGGEAEMCGNGARCFGRFAQRVSGQQGDISFETLAGVTIFSGMMGTRGSTAAAVFARPSKAPDLKPRL